MTRAFLIAAAALLVAGAAPLSAEAPYNPAERGAIAAALGASTDAVASLDDTALTARLLAHARIEAGQRVRPSALDPDWTVEPPRRDLAAELRAARAANGLGAWIGRLSPTGVQYQALRAGRVRYAALAAGGGWTRLPDGPTLRPGERAEAVAAVRARLSLEGYGAAEAADPTLFDPALEAALRAFQASHGLEVDGVLGPATRQALNVPAAERVAQIDANLERWRWAPASPPAERLEVDTGGQEVVLYRDGAPVLRMRAIVGSPKHPTPMFASRVEAVIFNPPWNVPTSIARNELLPAEARRPGTLAGMGIRWVDGHLQQRPGPRNSLGQIKFDLRNPFGVYLHDTPGKGLFAQPVRAFSHGCMRLEKPRELAAALLEPQGGSVATVEAGIAAGVTRRVDLRRTVPVYVQHWTVRADEGRLTFRPDIYGWDRKLAEALTGRSSQARTEVGAESCDRADGI